MMHRGARHVDELLKGKSAEEELAFWEQATHEMRQRQKELQRKDRKT